MAGFKIKLIDETYIGFHGNRLVRTTFKDAHLYTTVSSATSIAQIMIRSREIRIHDNPIIVDVRGKIVRKVLNE
jgi:hypothetical protein